MHISGIGGATLAKLRTMQARGGWMDSEDWFALHGRKGNRTPFLLFHALVLESFSYCRLSDRGRRVGYRLTEMGRDYLKRSGK